MGLFGKIKDLVGKDQGEIEEEPKGDGLSPEDIDQPPDYTFVKALHAAGKGNNPRLIRDYLKFNPKYALCKDWEGNTLIHRAAHFAHPQVLELLLAHHAPVNSQYKDKTPLHFALGTDAVWVKTNKQIDFKEHHQDQLATVKLLLTGGADPDVMDEDGETPLHTACRMGHADLAQLLMSKGADVDMLTGAGSKATAHTEGRSPLLLVARYSKNKRIIEFLLKQGANPNMQDKEPAYTALHYIAAAPHYEEEAKEKMLGQIARVLLENGADPNIPSPLKNQQTPLHLATRNNHVEVSEALLDHHADMLAETSKHMTPMGLAAGEGSVEMMECLLRHGVDVYESRALFYAAYCPKSTRPMEMLLERGVDINRPDERGLTAIFAAISANSFRNVKFLLDHGLDTKYHPPGATVLQHAFANWGAVEAMPEKKRERLAEDARSIIQILGGFD